MRIAVLGGDRRMDILAQRLRTAHNVYRDPEPGLLSGMDAAVAQRPSAGALLHMRPGSTVFLLGGNCDVPAGVRVVDLMADEEFVRENAVLTAEGAVCAAMNATDAALAGSRCLVVGYGRIAQALVRMLLAFDAHVTVAARREEARAKAAAAGADAVDMAGIKAAAARADYVFSTPPAQVLGEDVLANIKSGVPVMDLASPPYGVDLDAARRMGVWAWRESGLPGRYAPAAAARLIERRIRI